MTTRNRPSSHPALPFDQWPLTDRDAWSDALRPAAFLKVGGRGAAWRPASRRSALGAYGRLLAWLEAQAVDLATEMPSRRLTSERLKSYALFLLEGRSSVTAGSAFGVLCMAVIAMFPDENWEPLRIMQRQLARNAAPVRIKHRAPASSLFAIGTELLERAASALDGDADGASRPPPIRKALRDYRDGLLIALLASRPLRIKNLVELEIGKHVRRTPTRTTIEVSATETKTHVPICWEWPDALLAPLTRYLDEVRPRLISAPITGGNARRPGEPDARLWVGQGGTAFTSAGVNLALKRHTTDALGFALSAHRFRDSVATSIANDDATKVGYAAQMLGHKRTNTTEHHYIARDDASALGKYDDLLRHLAIARGRASTKSLGSVDGGGACDRQRCRPRAFHARWC